MRGSGVHVDDAAILAPDPAAPIDTPAAPEQERALAPRFHPLAWLVLAAAPVLLAIFQLGRIHPDEVFQALEPAWHRAFGYGVLAWEWRDGIRNWATPGLFSILLRVGAAVGIEHPQLFRALIGLPLLALHAFALRGVFLFARRRVSERGAWIAVSLLALCAPVLLYAGRTLSESISVGFILIALELLDREDARGRRAMIVSIAGGVMLGLAVVTRYSSAVMVLGALLFQLGSRRFLALAWTCLGGAFVLVALAALDWATWGKPLHSLLAYLDFNVFSGRAARQFGAEGPTWYLPYLFRTLPFWAVLGVPLALRRLRIGLPLTIAALYLLAITLTPHKEERFLYPVWVLLGVAGAVGIAGWLPRLKGLSVRAALAFGLLVVGAVPLLYGPELRDDQFRAIVRATRGADTTGLLIVNEGLWGSGGFFYIGKQIPWGTCDWPRDAMFQNSMRDRRINRAVTFEGRALEELQAAGFRIVETIGRETVLAR